MKNKPLDNLTLTKRYFATYSGVKLPIKLSQPLEESSILNRNTYFIAYYDNTERMVGFQKMVYGEMEMQHYYSYDGTAKLIQAEITDADQEVTILEM
jgi:hypothetical protein